MSGTWQQLADERDHVGMHIGGLDGEPTDGVVTLRRPTSADASALVESRDAESRRFLGEGSPDPQPTAVIIDADRRVVGWIDVDHERAWLAAGEVNIGYCTFVQHRGQGVARRALALFLTVLVEAGRCTTATLLIDPENAASIAVARRVGFELSGDVDGQLLFRRAVA